MWLIYLSIYRRCYLTLCLWLKPKTACEGNSCNVMWITHWIKYNFSSKLYCYFSSSWCLMKLLYFNIHINSGFVSCCSVILCVFHTGLSDQSGTTNKHDMKWYKEGRLSGVGTIHSHCVMQVNWFVNLTGPYDTEQLANSFIYYTWQVCWMEKNIGNLGLRTGSVGTAYWWQKSEFLCTRSPSLTQIMLKDVLI